MGRTSGMGMLMWILALALLFVGQSHQTGHYRSCSLGKGKAKLYNCDRKYDSQGTGSVRISDIDSPARYVIKLKENVPAKVVDEICERAEGYSYRMYSGLCVHKYTKVWIGMLMVINGGNLSRLLTREGSSIDHVEIEGTVRVCSGVVQQNPPNWGIDRIDHLPGQRLLNQLYTTAASGDGVHVYVLDTGIRCSHKDFRYQDKRVNKTTGIPLSRCMNGFDAIQDGSGTNDCHGHGTHCAGIVGGLTTGVAKDAILHPIRAMNCDGTGTYGAILASLDWISHNVIRPAVISMSLATQASISIDQAVDSLINTTGIVGVAAAGNFLQSTCKYSPARASSVIAVGASNVANQMSWFSNYGNCTTLFAPGEMVYSTYHLTDSSYNVLSGTSMACPHVAGTAALYLSQFADARPNEVRQAILDTTEPNGVANLKPGTTTKLLNTNTKQPFFKIHPRSFYDAAENTTQKIVVSLLTRPSKPVTLTPQVDGTLGYFVPPQVFFGTNTTWSLPQTLTLVLIYNPDFLDHSSIIRWAFDSRDTQYMGSPEGFLMVHNKDICRKCGQTVDNPKIIPRLPFHYVEDTSNFQSYFNESSNPKCHSSGPDVVFQFTAVADYAVNISLCETNTQFDTSLVLYEKVSKGSKTYSLELMDCNDDFCGLQSFLMNMPLRKNHTYIIVIDGYYGASGNVDFYMYTSGAPLTPITQTLPSAISVITSITTSPVKIESSICTRWLGENCEAPPSPLPIQAGFFWSPVAWGFCDKKCGGGYQSAVMRCFTGNYTEVEEWNCAHVPQPQQMQVCNVVACKAYSIVEGPWGECNQTCGTGTQKRQVTCMDSLGNTADLQKCGDVNYLPKEQLCNTQACNVSRWEAGQWNFCNLPCNRGQKLRSPICWSNNTIANDRECHGLQTPLTKMDCNTHPCQTFAWLVGNWNECPAGCHAKKSRLVQCVDGMGNKVGDVLCKAARKPAATVTCQQQGVICNSCQQHNCSNNGVCQKSSTIKFGLLGTGQPLMQSTECTCFKGWEGRYCEKPKVCKGKPMGYVLNGAVGCCPNAKVDSHQRCCSTADATIDINGFCCDGKLDACGICNGPYRSVDFQNQCCPTLRDEKGICCASGVLDECYICDGDGTTCATNITITAMLNQSVQAARSSSKEWTAFMIKFMTKIATRLHVAPEALLLTGVQTMNSEIGSCDDIDDIKQGCLTSVTKQFLGFFNFTVLPIPSKDLTAMKIEVEDVRGQLSLPSDPSQDPSEEFIRGVKLQSIQFAARAGICGNGMCERGERCDQYGKSESSSGPCCLEDCSYVSKSCAAPADGPKAHLPCSSNGICLDASGQCSCFPGYQGDTCGQCESGWTQMPDGTCAKISDPLRMQVMTVNFSNVNVTLPPGPWNDNITVTKGTAAAGILGTMVAVTTFIGIICCIKQCCREKRTPPLPAHSATGSSNIEMNEQNRQAQEARRKSLAVERREAVQERKRSLMHGGGADRKSLLMEPAAPKSPPAEALAPATMQSEQGTVINKLRRSVVGDSALVIGGLRKSLSGDQDYNKLDPSNVKAVDRRYQNAPSPPRYEEQQFQDISLAPQRSERQDYQRGPQQMQSSQNYAPRYDGPQYQGPQFNQISQTYTPRFEEQQYQNASSARYTTKQFQNEPPPQSRHEAQLFQTNPQPYPPIFQPRQHFQIIPIPTSDEMGPGSSSNQYGNTPSQSNVSPGGSAASSLYGPSPSSMGVAASQRYTNPSSPSTGSLSNTSRASPTNPPSKAQAPHIQDSSSFPNGDDSLI